MSRQAREALGNAWFKARGRGKKAALLAQALIDAGVSAETAASMEDFNWDSAAQISGGHRASPETKAVAVGIMDAHEAEEVSQRE